MINKYPEIDKLFGTAINSVSKPHVPFIAKTWHYVVGGIILALAIYGGYQAVKKVKGKTILPDPVPRHPDVKEPQKPTITVPLPDIDVLKSQL
jgi:hypothetical protein